MRSVEGLTPWPAELAALYREKGLWEGRTLMELIEERAAARPDHPAVACDAMTLTYAQLLDRAHACGDRMLRAGLRADDRIVVQLPNGWQFVVLLLACLRTGILPVMALPTHREHELRYLVDHAEARALAAPLHLRDFDHAALAMKLRETTETLEFVLLQGDPSAVPEDTLALDSLCAARARDEEHVAVPQPDPSAVAVFLLSGGTTGMPKLIARTHDDYVCNVRETARHTALGDDTVYLGTLPLGHNFPLGCPGILGTLIAGGTIVPLASPHPERTFAAIERFGVTHTAAVPAVVATWLDHASTVGAEQLSSLRVLQVGGARLADELAARVVSLLPGRLQQVFGMAEGLINLTRLDDPVEIVIGTQGRPACAADEVRIINEESGQEVAVGEPGLLLTRGPYTPRGYYNAPEANARSFTPDGWYISGDIVVQTPEGNFVVSGRSKDMINRGGENISAEEIENLAYRLEAVRLAAAVAMPDAQLGERVCLFAVLHDEHVLELEHVRNAFQEWGVAAYKHPDRLETVDELPLTKVGKIDKKALRELLLASLPAS